MTVRHTFLIPILLICVLPGLFCGGDTSRNAESSRFGPEFEDVSGYENVRLDIRYASENNFTHKNLYGTFAACFLHRQAARKLKNAVIALTEQAPGFRFLIFDCLRPRSVQRILWQKVRGTPQEPYVANPDFGSIHNFGFALDLSLVDSDGNELDMGTPYDTFSPLSEPVREEQFLKEQKLSQKQIASRRLLRRVMEDSGFFQLGNEWWHYDALPSSEVRASHSIVE